MKKKVSQDKVVYTVNYIMLTLLLLIVLYPIIYIISCSFSSGNALMAGKVRLLPVEFTLDSYKAVFKYQSIWSGYLNSIIYTVAGTVLSVVLTLLAAYPLSREDFRGRKWFMRLILFTMMFSGGLIPSYLLVKNMGLLNSIWAIILPGAVSAYNIIVARTYSARIFQRAFRSSGNGMDVLISDSFPRLLCHCQPPLSRYLACGLQFHCGIPILVR